MMKRILLMTICIAALFLVGCSEDQIEDAGDKLDDGDRYFLGTTKMLR